MALLEMAEKAGDTGFLRELVREMVQELMEAEVESRGRRSGPGRGHDGISKFQISRLCESIDARVAQMVDETEDDVLAHTAFPSAHWSKIASTNPLERVDKEIERRSDVVGIFPNEEAIRRLVGAVVLEQSDE